MNYNLHKSLMKYVILVIIFVIAIGLRFYKLGEVPPSPNWDEVSLGYNAYSIWETGKDEYGNFLPLVLRSFDDYKPAIYTYLAVIPVKVFGLNTFAVRFPAAACGSLAVVAFYFLLKQIFGRENKYKWLVMLGTLLLALSPWHIHFSRVAFESNIGVFFNIIFVLFFFKGLKNPWFLLISAFFAGANIYTYQAEKVFTPILVLSLVLIYRSELLRHKIKYLFLTFIVGLVTLIPFLVMSIQTPEIWLRAKATSVASDQTTFLSKTISRLERDSQTADNLGLILDNRRFTYIFAVANGYLSHFDLNWLFINGDEARHHSPGMGLMYLVELPFFLLGIYALIFSQIDKRIKLTIFAWFLIAPIPASITSGVPHAVRTMRFLPIVQIFSAYGFYYFLTLTKNTKIILKNSMMVIICLLFLFNIVYYLNQNFVQQNYFYSASWQYGYKEAVEEIQKIEGKYEKIVVSSEPELDKSYMFFLYYLKVDPRYYQSLGGTISGGFAEDQNAFLKYHFRPIKWESEEKKNTILYVGRPNDFPTGGNVLKTIYFLNGEPAIKLVEG